MTTVGFGDFYAKTYLGRTVSVFACFYGIFLVSFMVVTMQQASRFKYQQERAFNSLRSILHFEQKRKLSALFILHSYRVSKFDRDHYN